MAVSISCSAVSPDGACMYVFMYICMCRYCSLLLPMPASASGKRLPQWLAQQVVSDGDGFMGVLSLAWLDLIRPGAVLSCLTLNLI